VRVLTRGNDTIRRFPMNGKRGPRNFYKGKNARNLGYISSKGGSPPDFHELAHSPRHLVLPLLNEDEEVQEDEGKSTWWSLSSLAAAHAHAKNILPPSPPLLDFLHHRKNSVGSSSDVLPCSQSSAPAIRDAR